MNLNRREFIQTLGTCAAGIGLSPAIAPLAQGADSPGDDAAVLQIGDAIAVADTAHGKVRGFILNGITAFRGIPYGADTSGPNRFMPPRKPAPWTEIRPALWWGNSAPQDMNGRFADPYQSFIDHWNYDELGEDCLRINVWTPALADGAKRPVIVWLHGGGFVNGNAIEQDGYHGENFARRGDAVFCSLNHRLGPMGFSNFAGVAGQPFAKSGNAGMLDIVAALEWVRDNIANFGGDPGNVTVIGQSGGGSKVCLLAAMPSARGLFHKAVALSGSELRAADRERSEKLGGYILAEAGLGAPDMAKLQEMPWRDYLELAGRAAKKLGEDEPRRGGRDGYSPVGDGTVIPLGPFYSDPSGPGSDIPMILSTVFNESSPSRTNSALENVTLSEVKEKLRERYRDKTDEVVDAYARVFPNAKPVQIWSLVQSNRRGAVAAADAKAKQPAPVYVSWFGWQPPLFDHRMRAFHCLDISFWFYNTDRMVTHSGGGGRARRLSARMSNALLHFMRTGNPNSGDLPEWPRYTPEKGETMVLNDTSEVKDDPDREARKALPVG